RLLHRRVVAAANAAAFAGAGVAAEAEKAADRLRRHRQAANSRHRLARSSVWRGLVVRAPPPGARTTSPRHTREEREGDRYVAGEPSPIAGAPAAGGAGRCAFTKRTVHSAKPSHLMQ